MWTFLLLTSAEFLVAVTSSTVVLTQCPSNCSCDISDGATRLSVDCQGRADHEQLSDQLDSLLSVNLTYGRLTSLSIVNTPLTHVPPSVCRLTTLTQLNIHSSHRLTRLPDNCLTNLSNLVELRASYNAIELLQDGVFDGLTKLRFLDLNNNRISYIGLSVFRTSSNLNNLFTIRISNNNLTSLEPWIIERGLIGSFQHIVHIDLSYNRISKFTNEMGLRGACLNIVPFVYVMLQYNDIRHFIDILIGWNVQFKDVLRCYRMYEGRINFMLEYYGNFKIACDCVDYYFFKMLPLQQIEYYFQALLCKLTDPLTKNSSRVDGFKTPLRLFVCELTERCPPGCVCVHRPANATLHIYCSKSNLTILPVHLPYLPDSHTMYKLDFSDNRLSRLEHRDYFVNTSILDVSNNVVSSVDNWEEIANIADVNLYGNSLTSLPSSVFLTNTTTTNEKLNIANNPWHCSCHNNWMSGWLVSISDRLTQKVLCYSPDRLQGKNIMQMSKEDFCVDRASEAASKAVKRALTTSMSSFAAVAVVLVSAGVIVYRLRVKLFTRWKFHPFDRDECIGEEMEFDVFLSCSSDDNLPHGNNIRQKLEQRGYRVCYPPRDFVAGDSIYDNIYNAVACSKRTVCFHYDAFHRKVENVFLLCLFDFFSELTLNL